MADVHGNGADSGAGSSADHEYWQETPNENQATYRHFIGLLKFGVIAGAIVLAFLAAVRPAPL